MEDRPPKGLGCDQFKRQPSRCGDGTSCMSLFLLMLHVHCMRACTEYKVCMAMEGEKASFGEL